MNVLVVGPLDPFLVGSQLLDLLDDEVETKGSVVQFFVEGAGEEELFQAVKEQIRQNKPKLVILAYEDSSLCLAYDPVKMFKAFLGESGCTHYIMYGSEFPPAMIESLPLNGEWSWIKKTDDSVEDVGRITHSPIWSTALFSK